MQIQDSIVAPIQLKFSRGVWVSMDPSAELPVEFEWFSDQIAGHDPTVIKNGRRLIGILKERGRLNIILKNVQDGILGERELKIYQCVEATGGKMSLMGTESDSDVDNKRIFLSELYQFVPRFYGCRAIQLSEKDAAKDFLQLEDITHSFELPCIMDIKIGRVTYDPLASKEKRIAEESKAKWQKILGFRVSGYRVHTEDGIICRDRVWGRERTEANIQQAFEEYLKSARPGTALAIVEAFLSQLKRIQEWFLRQKHFHFYASSLLFVYEGHPKFAPRVDLRMIDFSHFFDETELPSDLIATRDENYLHGLERIIQLFTRIGRDLTACVSRAMETDKQEKWDVVKQIAIGISKMTPFEKEFRGKQALEYLKELQDLGFFSSNFERYEEADGYLTKIVEQVEGLQFFLKPEATIYFKAKHIASKGESVPFDIKFSTKLKGNRAGINCTVVSGDETQLFHLKTHQHGSSKIKPISSTTDLKELLVYQLIHNIGIGPAVEFIIPLLSSKRTVFIATRDLPGLNLTFDNRLRKGNDELPEVAMCLFLLQLVLGLSDLHSNNWGTVNGKLALIDFDVPFEEDYNNEAIASEFVGPQNNSNTLNFVKSNPEIQSMLKLEEEYKKKLAREVLSDWDLPDQIEKAKVGIESLNRINTAFRDSEDMRSYALAAKQNATRLMESLL